jgi:hypothetical protein
MKLALDGVEICYQQSGCGQDIVWLAGGDMPGSSFPVTGFRGLHQHHF